MFKNLNTSSRTSCGLIAFWPINLWEIIAYEVFLQAVDLYEVVPYLLEWFSPYRSCHRMLLRRRLFHRMFFYKRLFHWRLFHWRSFHGRLFHIRLFHRWLFHDRYLGYPIGGYVLNTTQVFTDTSVHVVTAYRRSEQSESLLY